MPPTHPTHAWLKQVRVAFIPGPEDALTSEIARGLIRRFAVHGHTVLDKPVDVTDILFTTARFGEPLSWRRAMLFTGRLRFKLQHNPAVYTLVRISPAELERLWAHFEAALVKDAPDPQDYVFPGLAASAYAVLYEQGRRGGPILAIERLLQAQTKCLRVMLLVGDEQPQYLYHFDLVGAHPRSEAADMDAFYDDVVLRMVTTVSTHDVTDHQVVQDPIPYAIWQELETPEAMRTAARELGKRGFFTDMVRIAELVEVPAVADAVASQYSEGCFATWEPELGALIATVTGSARPVDKDNISEDDLAVLVGVRPGGVGALMRHVQGKRNDPPSSEAVEMLDMDAALPAVGLGAAWGIAREAPVVRSKLHGHRGVSAYNPERVEYTPLDPPYFHYIVSCATAAQAEGVKAAFSRAQCLRDPADPRQVAFTILPGHGLVLVEKWVQGKAPFQVLWEAMDAGDVVIASRIPQGPLRYEPGPSGNMELAG